MQLADDERQVGRLIDQIGFVRARNVTIRAREINGRDDVAGTSPLLQQIAVVRAALPVTGRKNNERE